MANYTATDIVLILTAFFAGLASLIAAWKGHQKLNKIQENTNGAATAAKSVINELQNQILELNKRLQVLRKAGPSKVDEIKKVVTEHDTWEREERAILVKMLEENTRITQEIRKYLGEK